MKKKLPPNKTNSYLSVITLDMTSMKENSEKYYTHTALARKPEHHKLKLPIREGQSFSLIHSFALGWTTYNVPQGFSGIPIYVRIYTPVNQHYAYKGLSRIIISGVK